MSDSKLVPKGLCKQEVERGHYKCPSIPYVPEVDEIREQVKKSVGGAKEFKIKLSDKTKVTHALWDYGSNEAFLIHCKSVITYYNHKSYFKNYEGAKREIIRRR